MPALVNFGSRHKQAMTGPGLIASATPERNGISNGYAGTAPLENSSSHMVESVSQTPIENVGAAINKFGPSGHVDVQYQTLPTNHSPALPTSSYAFGPAVMPRQVLPARPRSPVIKIEDDFDELSFRTGPESSTGLGRSSHSSWTTQDSPAKFPLETDLRENVDSNTTQDTQRGKKRKRGPPIPRRLEFSDLKPRTSIPSNMSAQELARQGMEAAVGARLNPFALHPDELALLSNRIDNSHVTNYLNIRNRILRLWSVSPLSFVTAEEAAGCASSTQFLNLARVAYEWLIRRGYINFGVLETGSFMEQVKKGNKNQESTQNIVVVGAGMAGIGCARQLENLLKCFADHWTSQGLQPPKVRLIEARNRIGGRIYSHPLKNQNSMGIPKGLRCTAETGAHIITGFQAGNPLNFIIRGQLGLKYHSVKDIDEMHDVLCMMVDKKRDDRIQKLFNKILEDASAYTHKTTALAPVEGDRALISSGKDAHDEGGTMLQDTLEVSNTLLEQRPRDLVFSGIDRLTGRAEKVQAPDTASELSYHASMDSTPVRDIPAVNETEYSSLGAFMDQAVVELQKSLNLNGDDMRLMNWHFANLEYANAAPLSKLSLGGWDQDTGNDFDGDHAQIVGGYAQVPRALLLSPKPLDYQTNKVVRKITYSTKEDSTKATILCSDGEKITADHVVLTSPLGVLKAGDIEFEPALPSYKIEAIQKLGFGVLNKVILAYDKPFWDVNQDIIGCLRRAPSWTSDQKGYSKNRGRFYLFWNCMKTSGRPVLIGLTAGEAAEDTETAEDKDLVKEVTILLQNAYHDKYVPDPTEMVVTRWRQDPFAQGTYSYVGVEAKSEHYDDMAKPIGNLHFAGEATCGTHPATVHGAYISGLRAAGEIIDTLLGPIKVPSPLVPREVTVKSEPVIKVEAGETIDLIGETPAEKTARLEAFETQILKAIFEKLGPRPDKPIRSGANPFLIFSQEKWAECKAECDAARQAATGNTHAKAQRNEIRAALGQMWRNAPDSVKKPYLDLTSQNQAKNADSKSTFAQRLEAWDQKAVAIRAEHVRSHPGVLSEDEEKQMWLALGLGVGQSRPSRRASGLA